MSKFKTVNNKDKGYRYLWVFAVICIFAEIIQIKAQMMLIFGYKPRATIKRLGLTQRVVSLERELDEILGATE